MINEKSKSTEAVSDEISSLSKQPTNLTRNQVTEAVVQAIASLESKAIHPSEILDVMSHLAFREGNEQLGKLLLTSAQIAWETDCLSAKLPEK